MPESITTSYFKESIEIIEDYRAKHPKPNGRIISFSMAVREILQKYKESEGK